MRFDFVKNLDKDKKLSWLSILIILLFSFIPLFFNFPFRDNIYLSWEGAYRMYKGQMPFVDFGIPLGYGFWLMPTLSFFLFGPYMFSLIKIQVIINFISGITFKAIADIFVKDRSIVFLSVFLYCITYIFINFWPWYNHVVIVYQLIGIYFLLYVITANPVSWKKYTSIICSALFIFLSAFTKQDAGGFAILISGTILIYHTIITKKIEVLLLFGGAFILIASIFIVPLLNHDFLYWFNYGQDHHNSRINLLDFLGVIFSQSVYLKLYLLILFLIIIAKSRESWKWVLGQEGLFCLTILLVLFQAAIIQVTSYIPPDVNIFYHSFFLLFVLYHVKKSVDFNKIPTLSIATLLILFWWSGYYWRYANRIFVKLLPKQEDTGAVSISSWSKSGDDQSIDASSWVFSDDKEFERIKLPPDAIAAIDKLKKWRQIENGDIKVLNMSELTPLANILDYELETNMPLWYHLNVGMFDRELEKILNRIDNDYYDLILFENIPNLNNFYPFAVRDQLRKKYTLESEFQAPRDFNFERIEVYQPKNAKNRISQLD